jgi:hypothetical protein
VNPRDHGVLAVSAKGLGSRHLARDPSDPYPVPFAAMSGQSPSLLPNSTFPQPTRRSSTSESPISPRPRR